MIELKYEDLISGDPLFVPSVGHIRSPYLWELKPAKGIGLWQYNLYLNVLLSDKEDALRFVQMTGKSEKAMQMLRENDKLETFDILTLVNGTRELLCSSLGFFIVESLQWDKGKMAFLTTNETDEGEQQRTIGCISRDNYNEIRDAILRLNYIKVEDNIKTQTFASDEARELWEKAQKYLKETNKSKVQDKNMSLGNLISKFCALNNGYTLFNVYELTVFQFYDQFFQNSYLRAMSINDMAYSMYGGEKYDAQAWLKPIYKL